MPSPQTTELEEVRKLTQTIECLCARTTSGWVRWRHVAKEQMGSEEFAVMLSSLASMEPYKKFFTVREPVVRLTEEGRQFARQIKRTPPTDVEAIADGVRKYASRLRRTALTVTGIYPVAKVDKRFVQAFKVDAEELVASETPCEYRPKDGSGATHGTVIGQEPDGSILYVRLDREVPSTSLPGVLSIDRAYLLYALAEQLRSLKGLPERMELVLGKTKIMTQLVAADDSLVVAKRLAELSAPWTRFLWGPPGAGKTYGLGYLIAQLMCREPNSRTLLVAPSNRAVDVAIEMALGHILQSDQRNALTNREILRFGYPRRQPVLDCPELLGSPELDELSRKVKRAADRIQKAERDRARQSEIAVMRAEMLSAQEDVKLAVAAHVGQCRLVATTVTLAYLSGSPIANYRWDNVIVDEVTMVTPAMCTFLASLATKRFLLAGDPRQLGPVYEVGARSDGEDFEWMGRDIFDKIGLSEGESEARKIDDADARLARISSQRRCAAPIWNQVSHLYPGVNHGADETKLRDLLSLPPSPGDSVVVLDTCRLANARCTNEHRSWSNPGTADLALSVARQIASEASRKLSVAIIAPYRAQVRLLRKLIRQEQQSESSVLHSVEIDAGTVHQFQGSDADVIIFDMVDGRGRTRVGNLLRGDGGMRLVNVAITRAKGKLIVLADSEWCKLRMAREDNPLLWNCIEGSPRIEAGASIEDANYTFAVVRGSAPKVDAQFRVGDTVRVTDGPFCDFAGKITDVDLDTLTVNVAISVYGRATPLKFTFNGVERVADTYAGVGATGA